MNFHQTPEEIIKNANAEQRILWNDIFLRYGSKIGISQLFYAGVFAGSEFAVYSANKIYLCLNLKSGSMAAAGAGANTLFFYKEGNAASIILSNTSAVWNTTAAALNYFSNSVEIRNLYFSRIAGGGTSIIFIGYRLSI